MQGLHLTIIPKNAIEHFPILDEFPGSAPRCICVCLCVCEHETTNVFIWDSRGVLFSLPTFQANFGANILSHVDGLSRLYGFLFVSYITSTLKMLKPGRKMMSSSYVIAMMILHICNYIVFNNGKMEVNVIAHS